MKQPLEKDVYKISNVLEFFIASLIVIVIFIFSIDLLRAVVAIVTSDLSEDILITFLEKALNLVIGIEFVKMLCNHKPGTVIEVLLFAIARQMIVEHLSVWQTFMGVISIGVLFAIRKYLFIKEDRE